MAKSADEDARWLKSQVKPTARRAPQPIAEVLSRLMARKGYANVQIAYEWSDVWKRAAGKFASRSRPGKFSGGVLEVVIRDSATLQEVTFQKKQLLATIRELAPDFKLKDLRFKVGPCD